MIKKKKKKKKKEASYFVGSFEILLNIAECHISWYFCSGQRSSTYTRKNYGPI